MKMCRYSNKLMMLLMLSGLTLNNRRTTKEMIFLHQDEEDSDRSKCFFLLCLDNPLLCFFLYYTSFPSCTLHTSFPYTILLCSVLCFFTQLHYISASVLYFFAQYYVSLPAILYFFAQLHCTERVKRARSVSVTQKRST